MGYHFDLIKDVLKEEGFSQDAIDMALSANAYTDLFQQDEASYAIDNVFCEKSKKLVECLHHDQLDNPTIIYKYTNRLIQNTYDAIVQKVANNDYAGAMMIVGITSHIINDFYAHSNWAELQIPAYTGVKDATYFEVKNKYPDKLDLAIQDYKKLGLPLTQTGLFTNGSDDIPTPKHDDSNKDYAGRPNFDYAYQAAYKANLQWVRLIKEWIGTDLNKPLFLQNLYTYDYPDGNLNTLANIDEGTIRWIFTYAGVWKHFQTRWSISDILADDMPNVPGIGFWEDLGQDYPYLGIEWFSNCALIAPGLVQAKSLGTYITAKVDKLAEALAAEPEDFEDIVQTSLIEVKNADIPALENSIVGGAYSYMAGCFGTNYNAVKWLRLEIPEAEDLDKGDEWLGVNNEEIGGTSDYWVLISAGDFKYTESEYVDNAHPMTNWGALRPLWNNNPIAIKVEMFESDPTNHKDERMDICNGSGNDFTVTYNPATGKLENLPAGCEVQNITNGFLIKSWGSGDLRAQIIARIYKMNDRLTAVPVPVPELSVKYKCGDAGSGGDNHIKPQIMIVNNSTNPVPLSELTARYWYTAEGSQTENFWVDYAAIGGGNITGTFTRLAAGSQRENADSYLELGFKSGAGSIAAKSNSGEMQLRFNKTDWSMYNENNDYSYSGSKTSYTDWNRITLYRKGQLVYGIEPQPGSVDDQSVPTVTKNLTVISLKCDESEDVFGDEARLKISCDGYLVSTQERDMEDGDLWNINAGGFTFKNTAKFRLWDIDGDLWDDDDFLGEVITDNSDGIHTGKFTLDDADYTITYKIGTTVTPPVISLKVYARDEGYYENNIIKPRLYFQNTSAVTVHNFDLFYYFQTENGKTPVLEVYYAPGCAVSLVDLGQGKFAIRYRYENMNVAPGASSPDVNGQVVGVHYSDWGIWDKTNDISNPGTASWKETDKITVEILS